VIQIDGTTREFFAQKFSGLVSEFSEREARNKMVGSSPSD